MSGCRQARRRLASELERELALEERLALDAHLAGCPRCARAARGARRLEEVLEALPEPLLERIDCARAAARVVARLDGETPLDGETRGGGVQGAASRTARRRVALALAAAAGALVVVAFELASRDGAPSGRGGVAAASGQVSTVSARTAATVQAEVRDALERTLLRGGGTDAELAAFEDETRALAGAGWPRLRFVEVLLSDADRELAAAAAAYVGARGDARSVAALERTLADPERRASALDALQRLGRASLPALARSLDEPGVALGALRALVGVGGPDAAAILITRLRRDAPPAGVARPTLLDALSQTGPAAVAALVVLAEERPDERTDLLARLPLVAGGAGELARLLDEGRLRPSATVYHALAHLQPPAALAWLEARCLESRERGRALTCLAAWAGEAPCGALLRLAQAGRLELDELAGVLRALLEADALRVATFTEGLVARADANELEAWLDLLLDAEHAAAAAALARLALAPALDAEARQWAALAVGERGTCADAEHLLARFDELDGKRLRAACLLSIHDHLGDEGVRRSVDGAPPAALRRLLLSLASTDRRDRTAYGLHRVTRALEGCHSARRTTTPAIP